MTKENDEGYWYADVAGAKVGAEYRFHLKTAAGDLSRIDPYAREVTNSIGNGVVPDPNFDWGDDRFPTPPFRPGRFAHLAVRRVERERRRRHLLLPGLAGRDAVGPHPPGRRPRRGRGSISATTP